MTYVPSNIKTFAATRETSDVIALAIFEIAQEGDEPRVWESPTEAETLAVMSRAWELADADTDTLHWGSEAHGRTA